MSSMLVMVPSRRQAQRIVYVGAVGGSAAIIIGLNYMNQGFFSREPMWILAIIAIVAFVFTTIGMMLYNRILLIAGALAAIVYGVGNSTMSIDVVKNASLFLQALAVVLAGLLIWAYIQSYAVLKKDVQQKTKYTALTVFAVIGSLVSLGGVILIAVLMLSVRACQLSGSSKCL